MEISSNDAAFLKKAITSNSVVLFLGAGFSADAQNLGGEKLPVGSGFAKKLWALLKYTGEYDDTELPTLYEAALKRAKPTELKALLENC